MSIASEPSARRRRLRIAIWATAPVPLCAALAAVVPKPSVLWNATDSEPRGLYVRSPEAPVLGRIVAFHAPASVFPYADERMGYLRRVPILKEIAATAGDTVCTLNGELRINGRRVAAILSRDSHGQPLPRWQACRRLRDGELFVHASHIPNSFDSRYYGPIRTREIVGVFRPVVTTSAKKQDI
jgi:conjugative transfer signal peptidase TraF